jgi:hypothetical protein
MKNLILSIALAITAYTIQAQTLEQIISKNLAARGGEDKLKKLTSLITEATIDAQGMEMPIKTTVVQNKGLKFEMRIMGMDNYMVVSPKGGMSFFPVRGQSAPEALPEEMTKAMSSRFDIQGEFMNTKEKGTKYDLKGEADIEGTKCFKIDATLADGKVKNIYIDKESFLIIRESMTIESEGQSTEQNANFGDYKNVDGYMIPHTIDAGMGKAKTKKVTINSAIDEKIFEIKL